MSIEWFDCLRSPNRDVIWLANVTITGETLKCGLAYIQGNIPPQQPLVDNNGNQICSIYIPIEYASAATAFNMLSSVDDDVLFSLVKE